MDSSLARNSRREAAIEGAFEHYRTALRTMDRTALLAHLTEINAQLESQRRETLSSALDPSAVLSGLPSSIDLPVLRSIERDPPSSPRGREAQASPRSPQPSPLDLLARSSRIGPRLAAKLVAASARASARRSG